MARLIQFFDRPCCGPSAAQALSDFLGERLGDEADVRFHDLNTPGAEPVDVPAELIAHLSGPPAGPLPVMLVDGGLVAAGAMPNYLDALELARGERRASPVTLPMAGATGDGGSSCC
ncbi:hypothetical protein [Actinomadura sp. 9N407]|uniref:hypothetical protein n=1 Tax=Actinomadura sp. 9N407 TaxID=3375154 RepID=UPI003790E37F